MVLDVGTSSHFLSAADQNAHLRIREKMELDVQVAKLKVLKANHTSMQYEMQDRARKYYPQ